jgi:hypothetical protein
MKVKLIAVYANSAAGYGCPARKRHLIERQDGLINLISVFVELRTKKKVGFDMFVHKRSLLFIYLLR